MGLKPSLQGAADAVWLVGEPQQQQLTTPLWWVENPSPTSLSCCQPFATRAHFRPSFLHLALQMKIPNGN